VNKFKIMAVVVLICIFGQGAAVFDFVDKVVESSPKYKELDKHLQELSAKYAAAVNELETIKVDRDNILVQIKSLLGDRAKAKELEEVVQKAKTEASSAEKELGQAKEEINKLQAAQAQLTKERDELKIDYEKLASNTRIQKLKTRIEELRTKNSALQRDLNREAAKARAKERENSRLTERENKGDVARDRLTDQLNDYKKNYAGAVRKNKVMESKISQTPAKFTEIARQNKVLLRQTSEMHYNLGVFYTKNKEYDRAVAEFEKCIEINPNDAFAQFNLGYIYSEYLVNRKMAMEHFRHYLRLAKSDDPDVDWVKKYMLTWETYDGKMPMQ